MLWQTILSGLAVGSLYALSAIGLVLIFKTSNIVNFAQGQMAMLSTFVAFQMLTRWGFPYWLAALASLVFALVFGFFVYIVFLSRLKRAEVLSQIILTLGLYLVFRGVAGVLWGNVPFTMPAAVSTNTVHIGSAVVTWYQLFIMIVTLLLMVVFYAMFRYTKTGLAMRAVSQNQQAARLMGVSLTRIYGATWAVSTALGAIAGLLIAPILFLSPSFMDSVAVKAFAAAVLGGFSSLPGAVLGGLVLGVMESVFGFYISTDLKSTFVFLLIIGILYVRPQGLFGTREVKKV